MSEERSSFRVRWGDLDFNGHMRNTAFLDTCGDSRMLFFEKHGFSMREFEKQRFGPVVLHDELHYARELRLLESYDVTLRLAGLAGDGSRFRFENRFFRADGKLAATITSTGGWLSLDTRKLIAAPGPLLDALRSLDRTESFEEFPSSVK